MQSVTPLVGLLAKTILVIKIKREKERKRERKREKKREKREREKRERETEKHILVNNKEKTSFESCNWKAAM